MFKLKNIIKKSKVINTLFFLYSKYQALKLCHQKEKWDKIQKERLYDLLIYVKENNGYYRNLLNDIKITNDNVVEVLQKLPLLSKDIIHEQKDRIFSDKITQNWANWGNTGGSTGEPMRFPRLTNKSFSEPIHQYLIYRYLGNIKISDIILSVDGSRIPERSLKENKYYIKRSNFPYGKYAFSTLYLTNETIQYYISDIIKISPSFIVGYPMAMVMLANYILDNDIKFNIKLKGIYITSEVFSEADRKIISTAFGCNVIGQYGHTEMSIFAIQDKNKSQYYCMPLYGYTEVLNTDNKHVNIGEVGEIVVTGFSQIGLPFIRYKTGDLATYLGCKNGIVLIDSIQGRTIDYLIDNNGSKAYLTGVIFGGHLEAFNHINTWQLVQNNPGKVDIYIIKGASYTEVIEKEIINFFKSYNIEAIIYYTKHIPVSPNGKRKFVVQNCLS